MIVDDVEAIQVHFKTVSQTFNKGKTRNMQFRKQQLRQLIRGMKEMDSEIAEAMNKDMGYNAFQNFQLNTSLCIMAIEDTLQNIDEWNKRRAKDTMILVGPANSYLQPEPMGVSLVIGTWNYPFFTFLAHCANTIAAGNVMVGKPSEVSAYSSNVIKKLFDRYLDQECYRVVEGNVKTIVSLLNDYKWDLILFTGSPMRGRDVAQAAAKHLTRTVLELGGKSPTIVDKDCNLESAAMRIVQTKFTNSGQTCVAPDYMFIHESIYEQFKQKMVENTQKMHFDNDFKDCSKVVSSFHCGRLQKMLESQSGKVLIGGKVDSANRFIEPTLIEQPSYDDQVMKEEIFGPILPIYKYRELQEVIDYVNKGDKPLALYYYGFRNMNKLRDSTSSGILFQNDSLFHVINFDLPFGGVGNSGLGTQSGREGFDNCCHLKPVIEKGNINCWPFSCRYPPYTASKQKTWRFLVNVLGINKQNQVMKKVAKFAFLIAIVVGYNYIQKNYKIDLSIVKK